MNPITTPQEPEWTRSESGFFYRNGIHVKLKDVLAALNTPESADTERLNFIIGNSSLLSEFQLQAYERGKITEGHEYVRELIDEAMKPDKEPSGGATAEQRCTCVPKLLGSMTNCPVHGLSATSPLFTKEDISPAPVSAPSEGQTPDAQGAATPRTDAAEMPIDRIESGPGCAVQADFARTLERALAAALARADEATRERDALRVENAALKDDDRIKTLITIWESIPDESPIHDKMDMFVSRLGETIIAERDSLRADVESLRSQLATIQRFIREAVGSEAIEGCTPAECAALIISQRDNAHTELEQAKNPDGGLVDQFLHRVMEVVTAAGIDMSDCDGEDEPAVIVGRWIAGRCQSMMDEMVRADGLLAEIHAAWEVLENGDNSCTTHDKAYDILTAALASARAAKEAQ